MPKTYYFMYDKLNWILCVFEYFTMSILCTVCKQTFFDQLKYKLHNCDPHLDKGTVYMIQTLASLERGGGVACEGYMNSKHKISE